jgi:hemerythrin-like domain-containing protein
MKRFIHELKEEHRLIQRAAACLARLADGAIADEGFDAAAALDVLEFLERFANRAHQRKEERVLFPALLSQDLLGPRVGELLLEHRAEREALGKLHDELLGAACGDACCGERFAQLAHEYALAAIAHTSKEESELLPIAEQRLDPAGQQELLAGLRSVDEQFGMPSLAHSERALERIARRVGALPPVRTPASRQPVARLSAHARPLLLPELWAHGHDSREEAIVTIFAGTLVRERPEELALEPVSG